ncbi:MAG: hypothetical protein ACQKBU_08715 [Verrucomicrobiales bacterium]
MKMTKVCCQGCGADLDVAEDLRFVTCNYCNSRLEIVHDETVTHSKVLDRLEKQTGQMAGDLKVIRLQNDLERLDREWVANSERFMVSNKEGVKSVPSVAGGLVGGVVAIVFGVIWMGFASSMGAPSILPLFGLVFIGFALFSIVNSVTKAQGYSQARSAMEQQRRRLLSQIEQAKRGG